MFAFRRSSSVSSLLRNAPTKYAPLSLIGRGGMAEVWSARALFENGDTYPVAIKRVSPSLQSEQMRSMFRDEARLGMILRHQNVVRVYDAREVSGAFVIVMELIDGLSLKELLYEDQQPWIPLTLQSGLQVVRHVARALHYVHHALDMEGRPLDLVHRDVSPHNVMLGRDGSVKLADFGLADANVHQAARDINLVGGKLGYLAPEIVRGDRGDRRTDLFALGVMIWEIFAGKRLFLGASDVETIQAVARCEVPSLREIRHDVPESIVKLVADLLRADPAQRIDNAQEVLRRIDDPPFKLREIMAAKQLGNLVADRIAERKAQAASVDAGHASRYAFEKDMAEFARITEGQITDIGTVLDES